MGFYEGLSNSMFNHSFIPNIDQENGIEALHILNAKMLIELANLGMRKELPT